MDFGHIPLLIPVMCSETNLGPKLYVAGKDVNARGSTPLHLDVTSAVNIMVYVSGDAPASPGALWHIFRAQDVTALRAYLCEMAGSELGEDPIHAQKTYVTAPMLEELRERGVIPFQVQQRLGEAVFIPAGCAHQVFIALLWCRFLIIFLSSRLATFVHALRLPAIFFAWRAFQKVPRSPQVFVVSKRRISSS